MSKTQKQKEIREISTQKAEHYFVPPHELTIEEGYNVRDISIKSEEFRELKTSIKQFGVRTPLTVERLDGKLIIRSGHRRKIAVDELQKEGTAIKAVPVILELLTKEERVWDMLVSNQGLPLNLLEKGRVYERLRNHGFTAREIAEKSGVTQATVSNGLTLAKSPKALHNAIAGGELASTLALELVREHKDDSEKLLKAVERIVKKAKNGGKKKATEKTLRIEIAKEMYEEIFAEIDALTDKYPLLRGEMDKVQKRIQKKIVFKE